MFTQVNVCIVLKTDTNEKDRVWFKLTWRGTGKEIYFRYCQLKRLGSWKDFENIFDLEFWFLLNLHSEKNKIKIEDRYNANCNESFLRWSGGRLKNKYSLSIAN